MPRPLWMPSAGWFWERVDENGPIIRRELGPCWIWARFLGPNGYGMVRPTTAPARRAFRQSAAHRIAWEIEYGPPPPGLHVLHRCDHRPCVRPAHLFLGTDLDNVRDMMAKGRGHKACGERQGLAKLTEDDVRAIRRRRAAGDRLTTIAKDFGISHPNVRYIVLRQTWKHVTD